MILCERPRDLAYAYSVFPSKDEAWGSCLCRDQTSAAPLSKHGMIQPVSAMTMASQIAVFIVGKGLTVDLLRGRQDLSLLCQSLLLHLQPEQWRIEQTLGIQRVILTPRSAILLAACLAGRVAAIFDTNTTSQYQPPRSAQDIWPALRPPS